jgi:hypothetical protein
VRSFSKAKNCICGFCIGVAVCLPLKTAYGDEDCNVKTEICQPLFADLPHGPESDKRPLPANGRLIVTVATSSSSSSFGPNGPAVTWDASQTRK